MKPITPQECLKERQIDPTIAEVVNGLLKKNFNRGSIIIEEKEIVSAFLTAKKLQGDDTWTSGRIYDELLLNFEDFYREAGWKVIYDKPGYNETYNASYEFKPNLK
jgi:hypothetical protein